MHERARRHVTVGSFISEANVHVRCPHDAPVAIGASRQDRTYTFVSDGGQWGRLAKQVA
jgi:hypothetical protein